NIDPPGESGFTNLPTALAAISGVSNSYGPHTDDQEGLYASWQYKSFAMAGPGGGAAPPGDPRVLIRRDSYGVPIITADNEDDLFYGLGYAMAEDRLFQMEVFRHVGHGTLAALIGASGLPMDEAVRRATVGDASLVAQFHALPVSTQQRLVEFTNGINADIAQVQANPAELPAEFTLLGDLPIAPWTVDDSLSFGQYAGQFFGQFGGSELAAAKTYLDLIARFGQPRAEAVLESLYPLNDPRAPTSIAPADGTFPRHSGPPAPGSYVGSRYLNHNPAALPPLASLAPVATQVLRAEAEVKTLQRVLALPRWGSNSIIVSGRHTTTGDPMLYGGPQTGWAVPSFLWEVELHDPVRDQRGVMVPAIPLLVIGRTATTAWTVTSALDANSDLFVQQLDPTNTYYVHDGRRYAVFEKTETIPCTNPPTDITGLASGAAPTLCPVPPVTIKVYRTLYGSAVADPDSTHHLYVVDSTVNGQLLTSLLAWDRAGRATNVVSFGRDLAGMALGFNFSYVDTAGNIAFWHAGHYPIRPANVDPTLPIPGTGAEDWQGLETFANQPHVINPTAGFVVNWNNKPAVGWYSKVIDGAEGGVWGDWWEEAPLAATVRAHLPVSFATMAQLPHYIAYLDNPALVYLPFLERALAHTTNPQLAQMRDYLAAWNLQRDDVNGHGGYSTPAVVMADRFVEHLLERTLESTLGPDFGMDTGLTCANPPCHYVSVDNLSAPTYKFEDATEQAVLANLRGETRYDFLAAGGGAQAVLVGAAEDTIAELTKAQGPNMADWNEPVETGVFQPQGAISVPPLDPLPNRGSYGQVIEAVVAHPALGVQVPGVPAPAGTPPAAQAAGALALTGAPGWVPLGGLVGVVLWISLRRRRRRAGQPSR
ncbi:MAG: penicillin acylase family protein, partial [Mycobacteriales bacterium]